MNSLPRFVALALFVVLAALAGLLALPFWQGLPSAPDAAQRALLLSQRAALFLAATALLLSLVLLLAHTLRSRLQREAPPADTAVRAEVGALAHLARSSIAQGEELSRERDVRQRAEEDARLKQRLLDQSLDEKIRLGRDLHDGIIQSLYAAGLTLEAIRPLVASNPDEASRRLVATRDSLNQAIRDVRAYLVGLAPENLRRAGFARALSSLIGELQAGHQAQCEVKIDDEAAAHLSPEQSLEFLQIAREAVSNAFRHGGASTVSVRLQLADSALSLSIQDNGSGFDPAHARPGGHGLGNMRARAASVGASLDISSAPAGGARVFVTLPLPS